MKKTFNFRIEEMPSTCEMIRDSFARDLPEFTTYAAKYNATYLSALDLKLKTLDNLVNNKIKMGEVKKMTEVLYGATDSLRPMLSKIEGYVISAEGLTVPVKNFRFKEAREKISGKDMEGVLLENKTIKKLLEDNMDAVKAEGYTAAKHTEFSNLISEIDTQNRTRNLKVDEKEAMIQANMVFLNGIFKEIKKIADIGKRLYIFTDKEKTGDYTFSKIIGRISNRTPKEPKKKGNSSIEGVVKDFETEVVMAGVKVWTNDNVKGVISGVDGVYKLSVMAENCTEIHASMKGYTDFKEELEMDAGVVMELDVEMEKITIINEQ